jgi:hypothetical protein
MWYLTKDLTAIIFYCFLAFTTNSCKPVPSLGCNLYIDKESVKSSCGLTNGVRFEELKIIGSESSNSLEVYQVVSSFYCYNPGVKEPQTFWPEELYFDKPNGHYLWSTDTSTNGIYIRKGPWRDKIQNDGGNLDSVIKAKKAEPEKNRNDYDHRTGIADFELGSTSRSTCPAKFKPNTWYFVNFYDKRYAAYLYVDNEMNFKIDKINLPTNF